MVKATAALLHGIIFRSAGIATAEDIAGLISERVDTRLRALLGKVRPPRPALQATLVTHSCHAPTAHPRPPEHLARSRGGLRREPPKIRLC